MHRAWARDLNFVPQRTKIHRNAALPFENLNFSGEGILLPHIHRMRHSTSYPIQMKFWPIFLSSHSSQFNKKPKKIHKTTKQDTFILWHLFHNNLQKSTDVRHGRKKAEFCNGSQQRTRRRINGTDTNRSILRLRSRTDRRWHQTSADRKGSTTQDTQAGTMNYHKSQDTTIDHEQTGWHDRAETRTLAEILPTSHDSISLQHEHISNVTGSRRLRAGVVYAARFCKFF